MPVITFIDNNGTRHDIVGNLGDTIMQVATFNSVPGIVADCGGAAACATCRVRVDAAWESKVPSPGPEEVSMLEGLEEESAGDRLSCQITCTAEIDGLVVHIPGSQY